MGVDCRWKKYAFVVRSTLWAASSTAWRSVARLSVASRERPVVVAVAVAAGPAVAGVAAPPWPEKVSVGHGVEDRR